MTMQSKFATYGEGVTTTRPVARYAPWVNPYHPAPNEEAYAAAWKALRATERSGHKQKCDRASTPRHKYIDALRELSPQSVNDLAEWCGVSNPSAGAMMVRLEREGIVYRQHGVPTKGGKTPDLWFLEAAE